MSSWRNWKIETVASIDYPKQLLEVPKIPDRLYYRGEWMENVVKKSLAIVGSRRMTRYGRGVLEKFIPELVANGITIISGFMYGVDAEAHRLCLEAGGRTVAVLGGGLDVLTPIENEQLYSDILKAKGVVISEYEADFKPTLWSFPQRNRIVAGLATLGVLVVEAGLKSGSLITASLGRKYGRDVWAVPGPIDCSTSDGTNWLIGEGLGKMITSVEQITAKKTEVNQGMLWAEGCEPEERQIMVWLKNEALSLDELTRVSGISAANLGTTLTMMSLKNLVTEEVGRYYLTPTSRSIIR